MRSTVRSINRYARHAAPLIAAAAFLPDIAAAQAADDDVHFRASLYGYFPGIGGTTRFSAPNGGEIDIAADDLVSNAELAAMGSFELQKGRWGAFTDIIYMDIGDSIDDSSSLGAGTMPLPPGLTADASIGVKAQVWTLAASYRAVATNESTVDLFAGARLINAKAELDWEFNVDLGPLSRGAAEVERDSWDGIVGIKGRLSFGDRGQWFIPYYADVGAGDSDLTWQALAGFGYATRSFDVFATWRHLNYDFGPDKSLDSLDFSGPALGAAYRW